ncbi:MAG: nitroreductase [Clostridiales bacterium]|jgi:nitroreductase|nr:nitroreductase [Clostridiales bacterium]
MVSLYPYIFKRKSVRQYSPNELSGGFIGGLLEFSNSLGSIEGLEYKFKILAGEEIKSTMGINAPHYFAIYAKPSDNYLLKCGYLLQFIDLYLSSKNIGACWLGMAKPVSRLKSDGGLEYVMCLAFGEPKGNCHRNGPQEFKRKNLSDISYSSHKALEAVRLAPSSTNSQPWFIVEGEGAFSLYRVKLSMPKKLIYNKMNQVDMGIALCHLELALKQDGAQCSIFFEKPDDLENFEYMASIRLKQ